VFSLPGLREKNDVILFSQPWFGSSEFSQLVLDTSSWPSFVLVSCPRTIVWLVKLKWAWLMCFPPGRVTCAAVGGPFEDFPGALHLSFSWSMTCPGRQNQLCSCSCHRTFLCSCGVCISLKITSFTAHAASGCLTSPVWAQRCEFSTFFNLRLTSLIGFPKLFFLHTYNVLLCYLCVVSCGVVDVLAVPFMPPSLRIADSPEGQ